MRNIKVIFTQNGVLIIDSESKEGVFKLQFSQIHSQYRFFVGDGVVEASLTLSQTFLVNLKSVDGEGKRALLFNGQDYYRFFYHKENGLFIALMGKDSTSDPDFMGVKLDDSLIQDFLSFFDAGSEHILKLSQA